MTLAVGHVDDKSGLRVLDAIREIRPPFDPSAAVGEFAALLKAYRVHTVRGDRYSPWWSTVPGARIVAPGRRRRDFLDALPPSTRTR
jgi:hypothetical protein